MASDTRVISIPLKDSLEDEVIVISADALPRGDEVLKILQAERAQLVFWIQVALEYYRQNQIPDFIQILESAGSQASLEYSDVQNDQMRALDILAAFHMQTGYRERTKEKRVELFNKATVLFNTADKIKMYEMSHLTVRAWFYLYEKESRQNKLEMADQQFMFVVKQDDTNILALIGKAVISFNKRDYKTAIFYFRKALRLKPSSIADLRVGLGYCFAKTGKHQKARIAFERALELQPDNVSAMAGLAIINMNTLEPENMTLAVNLLGNAYRIQAEHPVVLVHLANHFFYKKELDRVEQLAWHALQITECEQIKAEACYQLARMHHIKEDFDKAFKYYYQSTQLNNGELTLAWYGLGQLYIHRNELEQAIKCFETILQRVPNNTETLKILGSLYAHTTIADNPGETQRLRLKGREALQKVLDATPDDVEVMIDLAQLLESCEPKKSLSLYTRAIDMLQSVEEIEPQPEMVNNVGALHMQTGDYEKAKKCFEQARNRYQEMIDIGERPDSDKTQVITIRYNLARCLEHLCRTVEAEQMYKDILNEMPNYIDCYMRLGCLTRDRGLVYDSSVWFKQAIPYDSASADAWTLIGNLHMTRQEWQPAQKKFEHILYKMPQCKHDAYSLISLGNVWLEQLNNPNRKREDEKKYVERALQMFQKALKLQPRNMYAANGIGCLMAFKRHWPEARDAFSQVREATSEFFDVWINIAHVYMEKEQYVPAIQMYTSAMKKFHRENDPLVLQYLSKAYFRAGKLHESRETLERAILECADNLLLKCNYAFVLKVSAKTVLKGTKTSLAQVKGAMDDLKTSERIFTFISKNSDGSLPGAKMLSRTICGQEASDCRDLLAQANTALQRAAKQDEEERRLRAKQEEDRLLLKKKMEEEVQRKEEDTRRKLEEAKALRSTFVEMTKDILKLPEIAEEKRSGGGGGRGRRRKGEDGEEFVNDSSDMGDWRGEGEEGAGGERRKKDKSSKKASRKKREKRLEEGESGSDDDRQEKKRRKKEAAERRAAEKLSAKQSAKIKSRAFLSSSEDSSDDDKPKKTADADEDDAPPQRDEFADSPEPPRIGDSDDSDDSEEDAKPKRKKPVMDSDDGSGSDENVPIIGASSDEDDAGPSKKPRIVDSDDENQDSDEGPSRKKKKRKVSSDEDDSD